MARATNREVDMEGSQRGIGRREAIKRAAIVGGAVVWTQPVIQTLTALPAFASGSPPPACQPVPIRSSIPAHFNHSKVKAGSCIWFSAVLSLRRPLPRSRVTIFLTSQIYSDRFNIAPPPASLTFDPAISTPTSTFTGTSWVTRVPVVSRDVFLDGVLLGAPVSGYPGGLQVTWLANFTSSAPVAFDWKWAAAVYAQASGACSSGLDDLGVLPMRDRDAAGTPEHFTCRGCVTKGATGEGGTDWTGSYSSSCTLVLGCPGGHSSQAGTAGGG